MPNQRGENMKLLPVKVKQSLLDAMEVAVEQESYPDRSSFVREAIFERLSALNISVPKGSHLPASRSGKGGPRTEIRPQHYEGNDSSSKPGDAARVAGEKAAASVRRRKAK